MTALEFAHWQAFAALEPLPAERIDYAAALIARSLFELQRNPKARAEPYPLSDFMPRWGEDPPEPDEEAVVAQLFQIFPPVPPKD